jgi:energy-coupling factor transporter ATP-binding protein EcfA2
VFKGDFAVDFCPGVNVLIGGNATGKTTLLKILYWNMKGGKHLEQWIKWQASPKEGDRPENYLGMEHIFGHVPFENTMQIKVKDDCKNDFERFVFIPEKDILEHAKGLLTFITQKQTGFSKIYMDVLINAQDIPTQKQSGTQQKIGKMIAGIIGGTVHWDKGDGSFYTIKTDGSRIPFASEASGYKKLGFLGLLVSCGQLESGTILFWDEPENSLNPELVPKLVDILLELSRNGVQIFLATHSEILASYFNVNRKDNDSVMFYSLSKAENGSIKADKNNRFDLLEPNTLTAEPVKLYERELEKRFGNG